MAHNPYGNQGGDGEQADVFVVDNDNNLSAYDPAEYDENHPRQYGGNNNNVGGGLSAVTPTPTFGTTEDDAVGPERLIAMLEEAQARPEETRGAQTPKEIQTRKEMVEKTWDQVRRWIWAHPTPEDRAAAAVIQGQANATPLHLMCKLNNPPTDVVRDIVEAAPEAAGWTDSHGWLPLHHACANGASQDVLRLLTEAYPEGKTTQDSQNRTPLHFYATRNSDNPASMAENVRLLSNTGASELPDRNGMLPMHYACAYGTNRAVLSVLAESFPEGLVAKENKGRTPLHYTMVNAHRDASPGVMGFLLESEGSLTVNVRDNEGFLPLHLLSLGLKGSNKAVDHDKRNNVSDCLKMYLAARPHATADFLTALQDLPDWLQDVAVVSPHVRNILNKKIIQRFPTSILMLDGCMLLTIIVSFEVTTRNHIDVRFAEEDVNANTNTWLGFLFVGGSYFLLRELIQIISLISIGALGSWFVDTTNWLDVAVITLVFYYGVLMIDQEYGISNEKFRTGVAFTKGVLWCAVIYFLKSTLVDFAVFVGGVFYVVQRLAAFLMAVAVILLAFAQMFYIVYVDSAICKLDINETTAEQLGVEVCAFPHCTWQDSLLKVYTMMMGEIGDETRYDGELVAQILYLGYAFLVVILLSNVLIAIVTDSYEIIQNDRAAIVFWSNRLDFVAEMDAIAFGLQKRLTACVGKQKQLDGGGVPGAPTHVQETAGGQGIAVDEDGQERHDPHLEGGHHYSSKEYFREGWKQLMVLFDSNLYDDIDLHPSNIEFWCYLCFRVVAVLFVIPIWIIAGFITMGWLWPPQIREYLFVQTETAISRAELERQKLEQLKEIQNDIKGLKTELRKEMAGDRDDLIRMKAEVEAVQSEVLSDLVQVKELMNTLLDMGNGRMM